MATTRIEGLERAATPGQIRGIYDRFQYRNVVHQTGTTPRLVTSDISAVTVDRDRTQRCGA